MKTKRTLIVDDETGIEKDGRAFVRIVISDNGRGIPRAGCRFL
jgi:hypothetical protein